MLDPGALQDALLNLIPNARDAMQGAGRIALQARVAGRWPEILVTDSGPGFSDEALARGTQPCFTTKGSKASGLGLPMVYDLVKLAGGTLRLSNPGGAQVAIRLPPRPHLVLPAEDDDAIRAHIREMLTAQGHSGIEAGSLCEAQGLTDLPGLTLILSDLQLGDGSGAALRGCGLPLVLMTALPPGDPGRSGLDGRVLTKPSGDTELVLAMADPDE